MALNAPVARPLRDPIPALVYRAAARSVTRVLVPCSLVLLALGVVEVGTTGSWLSLQLAAAAVLVVTVPGAVIASDGLARWRMDLTLRRMEGQLRSG